MVVALAVGMVGASLGEPTDHLFSPIAWAVLIGTVAMTVLFSVLGDLFESLIKREQGVKKIQVRYSQVMVVLWTVLIH